MFTSSIVLAPCEPREGTRISYYFGVGLGSQERMRAKELESRIGRRMINLFINPFLFFGFLVFFGFLLLLFLSLSFLI